MVTMPTLRRVLWRELARAPGQVASTALVLACGVASLVALYGTFLALRDAQVAYYREARFADLFASLTRAPLALARDIDAIPGVARAVARNVEDVVLDVPGASVPAQALLVGTTIDAPLDALVLRAGRFPRAEGPLEAVASEAFARANGLRPGDAVHGVIAGRRQRIDIVGLGLSPAYIYEVAPGALLPDSKRFGVLWLDERVLSQATGREGAFDDVAVALAPGASAAGVAAALDAILAPYGGRGAFGRDEQLSHRFLSDEIAQNRVMAVTLPLVFLVIAAFLLHVVLIRQIELQRGQIGLLRAFGYRVGDVVARYASFALVTVALGLALGVGAGAVLGQALVALYRDYYRFPALAFALEGRLVVVVTAASLVVAMAGAAGAALRVARLAPADAIRPPAPAPGVATWTSGRALQAVSPRARMLIRGIARRPWRAAAQACGVACGVALVLVGFDFDDAIAQLVRTQFEVVAREDVTVAFRAPESPAVAYELARLPGVERVELVRTEPARLRAAHRSRRVDVVGLEPGAELRRLVDRRTRPIALPVEGIALSAKLAELLDLRRGDRVTVEFQDRERRSADLVVAALIDDYAGLAAYMDAASLARATGSSPQATGALLRADATQRDALYAALKRMPGLSGVSLRDATLQSFREIVARSFNLTAGVDIVFACLIAFGLVYNGARVSLSERTNELATLRVLGYTRGEAAGVLLAEQGLLTALALPLGVGLGVGLVAYLASRLSTELYRVPFVVTGSTVALSLLVVVAAAAMSGALVAWRVRALDPLTALKVRE